MRTSGSIRFLIRCFCCVLPVLLFSGTASAQTLYSTGFENPLFQAGILTGQSQWSADGNSGAASIQTTIVRTGSQAVRLNAALNEDSLSFYYRPVGFNTNGNKVIEVIWDMYLQGGSEASLYFGVDCYDSNVNLIGSMAVDALTRFVNVSDGDTYRDTATLVTRNAWNSFRLRFDYAARTFSAYVNGVAAATGLRFGSLANNTFGDADLFNDNRINPAGNDSAYFDNLVVAEVAPTAALSGIIHLEEVTVVAGTPVTFAFRQSDGTPLFTRSATLSADGGFSIADLPRQNYLIQMKGAKWLAKNIVANMTVGNVTGLSVSLKAGDANNDNSADVLDLDALIQAFDTVPGDLNWNGGAADFNCDGSTDVLDLDLLLRNFDLNGDL